MALVLGSRHFSFTIGHLVHHSIFAITVDISLTPFLSQLIAYHIYGPVICFTDMRLLTALSTLTR